MANFGVIFGSLEVTICVTAELLESICEACMGGSTTPARSEGRVGWVDIVEARGTNRSIPQHGWHAHVQSRTQSRSGRVVGVASGPEGNGRVDVVDLWVNFWVDIVEQLVDLPVDVVDPWVGLGVDVVDQWIDLWVDNVDPWVVDTMVVSKLASLTHQKGFTGTPTSSAVATSAP